MYVKEDNRYAWKMSCNKVKLNFKRKQCIAMVQTVQMSVAQRAFAQMVYAV